VTTASSNPSFAWTIHGERTVYDNPWVQLALIDVEPPDHSRFEHHLVRLRPVAVALVVDEQDRVLMLRRYRFVTRELGWELPGGFIDEEEDAITAAARETEEETGWRPERLERLVTFQPMVGMVDAPHTVVTGQDAKWVSAPSDPEEIGEIAWVPLDGVLDMMTNGQLFGSATLVGLLYFLSRREAKAT